MKFYHLFNLILLSIFISSPVLANDMICYDDRNSMIVGHLDNWISDYKASKDLKLCVVYVKKGHDITTSPSVFYPRYATLKKKLSFNGFINIDLNRAKKNAKKIKINKLEDHKNSSNIEFKVFEILNGKAPNKFEYIAYTKAKGSVFLAVMTSINKDEHKKQKDNFYSFLNSMNQFERSRLKVK